jgi:prepilin-type N-terminal cleavage/methylation domain-containing protein
MTYKFYSKRLVGKRTRGFTMIEMLISIAILALITASLSGALLLMVRTYSKLATARAINRSARSALERLTRDIHNANRIDTVASTLGTNPGLLSLEFSEAGVLVDREYYIESGVLKVRENGVELGPITRASVNIDSLIFQRIDALESEAIKIDITLSTTVGASTRVVDFFATSVLRDSYD